MNKLLKQAFTLIELLVVIAIIGILSGLIVVSMGGMTTKATIARAQVFSNSLKNSLMMGMVGEWKFDGPTNIDSTATSDDLLDSWGGNNTGISIYNTPKIKGGSDCVFGKCLYFDGDDYITCGSGGKNLSISGDILTISVWVKPMNVVSYKTIISKWGPWIFFLTDGRPVLYIGGDGTDHTVTANSVLSTSTWYHLVMSYTHSDRVTKFYLNGKPDGSPSFSVADMATGGPAISIGSYGGSYPFNGFIDNVQIYNAAMPTSQIKKQYYSGLNSLFTNGSINAMEYSERINSIAER